MGVPACLLLADSVFPKVRAAAARKLVAQGWSQQKAGSVLGLSQAMVSKHISAAAPMEPLVERLADELVREASTAAGGTEGHPGPGPWCSTLATATSSPAASAALDDLLEAERILRSSPPTKLMPQVGLNIARALPSSTGPDDVLAYPGRLVEAGGRIAAAFPPAWGGSGHLARLLLALRSRSADTVPLALANVRGGPAVAAALDKLGLDAVALKPKDADVEAAFLAAVGRSPRALRFHDAGTIGLEPCLYLAAPDARTVARDILRLHDVMP